MTEETKSEKPNDKTTTPTENSKTTAKTLTIEAAARRLERLLGGSSASSPSTSLYNNPAKIVRRWLGNSSGTASKVESIAELTDAAKTLLDPSHMSCGKGVELLGALGEGMMTDEEEEKKDSSEEKKYLVAASKEVEAWLLSLAVRFLWREKKYKEALDVANKSLVLIEEGVVQSTSAVGEGRRDPASLFPLLARMYRYRSLVSESMEAGEELSFREELVHAHRMACLRRDYDTQATLLNLLLRDLLKSHQIEQAHKLLSNSTFPETASNNQLCRYLYHSGRIQALRLEYTTSYSNLSQCLRKCPTNTALGFRIAVQRLLIVVQLLMGEIPERSVFFTPLMQSELLPYLKITQAVRRGDLKVFSQTVADHAVRLRLDETYTLISRLAHSVVKAGLRKLNTSYSRISLSDIAQRLALPNASSAEFVVAKAVKDGVIDATIDHEAGYVRSHELLDIYATMEPAEAFHRRIAYCLTTHNDAVRGMRYPPDAYKKQLEASRAGSKLQDDKTDEEKAQELEDEMDDEY